MSFTLAGRTKRLDFGRTASHAKKMTNDELQYAICDARQCVERGVNPDFYRDQIIVYRMEQAARAQRRMRRSYRYAMNE